MRLMKAIPLTIPENLVQLARVKRVRPLSSGWGPAKARGQSFEQ